MTQYTYNNKHNKKLTKRHRLTLGQAFPTLARAPSKARLIDDLEL